jgi:ubiquinol-cytochrome c reductase cytochrome c subunit
VTSAVTPAAALADVRSRRSRARRRSGYLVLALTLGLFAALYAALAPSQSAVAANGTALEVSRGRALYLVGCATCHGLQAQGTKIAPSLIGVGAAAVDFQVGTGRMPLQRMGPEALRKQPKYSQPQINALAAYIASLAPGPAIPAADQLDISKGDPARGGNLFRANCAQCHNFNGSGGALTEGKYAPSLYPSTSKQIYEAMLNGPEQMPVFGDNQLSPQDKLDIITFLKTTHAQADPGGFGLGRIGPVSEGLVAWLVGTGVLVFATLWIGARI